MRRALRASLLSLVAAVALAAPAAAQRSQARRGFWMDGAVGYGRLRVVCLHCLNDRGADGGAVTLSIGGTVSRYVLVGVEAQLWDGLHGGLHEHLRSLNLVAHWYPWGQRNGFFLRGGTGLVDGTVIASDSTRKEVTVRGFGQGISLSVGYDLSLSRHLALTFQAGDQISALGDLVATGGVAADDTIAYVSRLSIALTWR